MLSSFIALIAYLTAQIDYKLDHVIRFNSLLTINYWNISIFANREEIMPKKGLFIGAVLIWTIVCIVISVESLLN